MVTARLRNTLVGLASLLGVGELVDAPFLDATVIVVAFGVIFLVGAGLVHRGRYSAGAVMVGVLALFLVLQFFGWQRHGALDWVVQTGFFLVSLAALGTAIAVLATQRATTVAT